MKRKLYTLTMVLLIAMLAVTPVYAGGISGSWGLGSIKFDGNAFGFSGYGFIQLSLEAKGNVHLSCVDPGNNGNIVPGQNPVLAIDANATPFVVNSDINGKFPIHLESDVASSLFTPEEVGCPNSNWIVQIDWIDWTWANITVQDLDDATMLPNGNIIWSKNYACTTTPTTIDCKGIK